ncbi:phage tail protein [Anaerosalibacter bizertensis]|uniref:phage tail protein n=1 Tax=Anaerosalibacter bizertensis TaxID=932217 RepID=UPI001C0F2773|nr:phage tail protein [Anaerosalibacter bizertensis]MBU5293125.1 phage tail protein [Anaerosalibacter bizertensis]
MPEQIITDFSPVSIKNASVQFIKGGVREEGKKFGCMGTLEAETEVAEKVKNCEGATQTITIPKFMTVTIGAHIKRDVLRDIFGMRTEGLKPGIYSYGINSKGKRFTFTADVIDEFEDIKQLIAFSNCSNMTGMTVNIDNDADEVAYTELEFQANADEEGEFYYEAFIDELDEETVSKWHKTFSPELVKAAEPIA